MSEKQKTHDFYQGSEESKRGIKVILTPEQEKILESEKTGFFDIGFITPKQIVSYTCDKCENNFEESPKAKVYITFLGKASRVHAGYMCNHCDEYVFTGHLESGNKVPAEFIVLDETGDFKKPTPESIEELFEKISETAKKGQGNTDHPGYDLKVLNLWCEKIGYTIDKQRFKELEATWKQAYIQKSAKYLPELVDDIINYQRYSFNHNPLDDTDGMDWSHSSLPGQLDELFDVLSVVTLPDDIELKSKIVQIMKLYEQMYDNAIDKVKDRQSELDKILANLEKNSVQAQKTTARFVAKAGLTFEQAAKMRAEIFDPNDVSF
ncbi:hypothetical protein KY314_02665 [Candidatus Woesearchaeota archaeon]|nr:hypothetical protein [Candidatus Woesearchaeota archaeon]